jgi:hypothetical protein
LDSFDFEWRAGFLTVGFCGRGHADPPLTVF